MLSDQHGPSNLDEIVARYSPPEGRPHWFLVPTDSGMDTPVHHNRTHPTSRCNTSVSMLITRLVSRLHASLHSPRLLCIKLSGSHDTYFFYSACYFQKRSTLGKEPANFLPVAFFMRSQCNTRLSFFRRACFFPFLSCSSRNAPTQ